MQKYKKIKKLLSVSTAVCLAFSGAGSLTGCSSDSGSTDSERKNDGNADEGTDGSDKTRAMGRYLEEKLTVPEDCEGISSLQVMADGSRVRIAEN